MRVLLVHGIMDTGAKFRRLQPFLEARGHRCLAPSLTPRDGRDGLLPMARQLSREIDRAWGREATFAIVGFSMGGLIARLYLQQLGGAARVDRFFAVSVPHRGSLLAYGMWGRGAREMRPGSALLKALDATVQGLEGLRLRAYWTPFDAVIVPPRNCIWPAAENRRVLALCHPCMLWHRTVLADIAEGIED